MPPKKKASTAAKKTKKPKAAAAKKKPASKPKEASTAKTKTAKGKQKAAVSHAKSAKKITGESSVKANEKKTSKSAVAASSPQELPAPPPKRTSASDFSTYSMESFIINGSAPCDTKCIVLLAHGAGAGMNHYWLDAMAEGIVSSCRSTKSTKSTNGVMVARFNFPYMIKSGGKFSAPDRLPKLLGAMEEAYALITSMVAFRNKKATAKNPIKVLVAGKSMGGRVAAIVANRLQLGHRSGCFSDKIALSGVMCFGYPFYPIGSATTQPPPWQDRLSPLDANGRPPTFIFQGERDTFGGKQTTSLFNDKIGKGKAATVGFNVKQTKLPQVAFAVDSSTTTPTASSSMSLPKKSFATNAINLFWMQDGDHSFAPRKSVVGTDITADSHVAYCAEVIAKHIINAVL